VPPSDAQPLPVRADGGAFTPES